ncbi:glycoside hydrolase family 127 protein [Ancylomarina sp. 16SWW S1-10-2]|uniref:glycoside hydrolase family 127 protein n=1 Tax=Ancylomarina sp. 16SWW S1-10-2 TaxID=2499681 RepID=UPI0012AE68CE|nr:beta-L-arabinofuranosidase domain-containing protein [Ancylomarina sp. 16SWW S1-10-2]MRT91963.1 glycoside hydrolase family 127 protein [Ancylomarina sp. 16SWW S1-10-2]
MKKLLLFTLSIIVFGSAFAQKKGIINNSESPNVKFKSIDIGDCTWTEGFWADKFKVCEETMVPYMGELLCGDIGHALNNFKIAAGLKEGEHKGMKWQDGDFYKWMEAEMYVYAQNKDKKILADLDKYIDIIGKAQQPDGYLQTQVTLNGWERNGNRQYHEMYNSGHLYTSACIHNRITGKTNFLDIAIKHADNLYDTFMVDDLSDNLKRFGFNQTQIMGLVELYRTTKDEKYLKLAELFINLRGQSKVEPSKVAGYKFIGDMVQERTPLRKEKSAEGHAVLALYFYAGAADVAAETGEKALVDALDRLWDNVVEKKMYITGACGQTHHGVSSHVDMVHEGFINEYMMPNLTAYNETCANICNSMFSYRMLGIHGESKYADIMELVLFNSALSGISIEGKDYFYANPLRVCNHAHDNPDAATEFDQRIPYVECFCCPPNLVRTIAKVSGWAYSLTDNGVAVNLYGGNKLTSNLLDGSKIQLSQVTKYPWEGAVKITVGKCKKDAFQLRLRIPDWANGSKLLVNGKDAGVDVKAGTYAVVDRQWKKGDEILLDMPMEAKLMEGNPLIEEVRNQVAIKRGPVVYCAESTDLPKETGILDVFLPFKSELKAEYKPNFLGGVSTISADVKLRKVDENEMYSEVKNVVWETYKTQFVPYFAWSNRGQSEMTVWMPILWE